MACCTELALIEQHSGMSANLQEALGDELMGLLPNALGVVNSRDGHVHAHTWRQHKLAAAQHHILACLGPSEGGCSARRVQAHCLLQCHELIHLSAGIRTALG